MTGSKLERYSIIITPLIPFSRYNLKRRVASLLPLSSEIFTEKVLTAQASSSAAAAKAAFETICSACQKTYYSKNAYQNHLESQKHRLRMAALHNGGKGTADDEINSVMSSTFSLGEPISQVSTEPVDAEAEAEFSDIVSGIKETSIGGTEPGLGRPSRPHHSANQDRPAHVQPSSLEIREQSSSNVNEATKSSDLSLKRCMFCNYESPSLKLSIMHMSKFHGMFIPEQPYLTNLEGLIRYLYGKIMINNECLHCHKIKISMSAVQTHMRDKGHCMIAFDSEEEMIEVGQFYDFSSTYSDDEADDEEDETPDSNSTPSGGVMLGSKRSEALRTIISGSNGEQEMRDGEENTGGWETDSSASSLDSDDLTAVPIDHAHAFDRLPLHHHHSHDDPRPHRTADGFHSHAHSHYAVFRSDYELHLPSGRTAGHRTLSRYYRQNLHNYPTNADRTANRMIENTPATNGEINVEREERGRELMTRARDEAGLLGVTEAKKREVRAVEKRERKREQRIRQQYQWGVDKRGNSQKHFRDPLLQ